MAKIVLFPYHLPAVTTTTSKDEDASFEAASLTDLQLNKLLSSGTDILSIDLRPTDDFKSNHLNHSISLCLSSTLWKRKNMTLDRLIGMMTNEQDRQALKQWKSYKQVVILDKTDGFNQELLKVVWTKFQAELGVSGDSQTVIYWLNHGLEIFLELYPAHSSSSVSTTSAQNSHPTSPASSNGSSIITGGTEPTKRKRFQSFLSLSPPKRPFTPTIDPTSSPAIESTDYFKQLWHNLRPEKPGCVTPRSLSGKSWEMEFPLDKEHFPAWLNKAYENPSYIKENFNQLSKEQDERLKKLLVYHSRYIMQPENKFPSLQLDNDDRIYSALDAFNNPSKNRYHNVWPFDYNRVRLPGASSVDTYVNASWVNDQDYICAQAPTADTVADFLKMIINTEVRIIISLSEEFDSNGGGRKKCERYWPRSFQAPAEWETFTNQCQDNREGIQVRPVKYVQLTKNLGLREFDVAPASSSVTFKRVYQLQCFGWNDHSIPDTLNYVLDIIRFVRMIRQTLSSNEILPTAPLLVHCSAGCGRTGVFCALDILLKKLQRMSPSSSSLISSQSADQFKEEEEDLVVQVIRQLRKERMDMVQTMTQMFYTYQVFAHLYSAFC